MSMNNTTSRISSVSTSSTSASSDTSRTFTSGWFKGDLSSSKFYYYHNSAYKGMGIELQIRYTHNGEVRLDFISNNHQLINKIAAIYNRTALNNKNDPSWLFLDYALPNQEAAKNFHYALQAIKKVDTSLDQEVIDDIFNVLAETIGFKTYIGVLEEQMSKMTSVQEKFAFAVSKQKEGYFDLIWQIAKELENKLQDLKVSSLDDLGAISQNLWSVLKEISKDNPRYVEAQEMLFDLTNNNLLFPTPRNEDEKLACLEEKFRFINRTQKKSLIDRIFSELCGQNSITPISAGIKGDTDVLINLAKIIREQNKRIAQLEQKVASTASSSSSSSSSSSMSSAALPVSLSTANLFANTQQSQSQAETPSAVTHLQPGASHGK